MQRLKSRAQFEAVMAAGATVSRTPHFALHRSGLEATKAPKPQAPNAWPPDAVGQVASPAGAGSERFPPLFAVRDQAWIGAILPKRWAKRAVTRNAIKRQIYTVIQDFEAQLPAAAHVVRLRSGFDKALFISATSPRLKLAVREELRQLFAGARR